ncbi:hypothetical protein [Sinomonas sp. G460-2]|uniref:hypothetical protein n=1 Tax=Sinomonas sp. G460-2 TaxID=3393464 RepID=UPI0039EF3C24
MGIFGNSASPASDKRDPAVPPTIVGRQDVTWEVDKTLKILGPYPIGPEAHRQRIRLWEKIFGYGSWHEPVDLDDVYLPGTPKPPPAPTRAAGREPEQRMVFNPPPGWPKMPPGWMPSNGWTPDPSWPALPPGWKLSVSAGLLMVPLDLSENVSFGPPASVTASRIGDAVRGAADALAWNVCRVASERKEAVPGVLLAMSDHLEQAVDISLLEVGRREPTTGIIAELAGRLGLAPQTLEAWNRTATPEVAAYVHAGLAARQAWDLRDDPESARQAAAAARYAHAAGKPAVWWEMAYLRAESLLRQGDLSQAATIAQDILAHPLTDASDALAARVRQLLSALCLGEPASAADHARATVLASAPLPPGPPDGRGPDLPHSRPSRIRPARRGVRWPSRAPVTSSAVDLRRPYTIHCECERLSAGVLGRRPRLTMIMPTLKAPIDAACCERLVDEGRGCGVGETAVDRDPARDGECPGHGRVDMAVQPSANACEQVLAV